MSFLHLEDLFVAALFSVIAGAFAWAVADADRASPLVSSATVVMERESAADETRPLPPANRLACQRACDCYDSTLDVAQTTVSNARAVLPPRPSFLN